MLEQKLQQKLFQKLSPQQIQMIKLLEIPIMELEQRIKKELEENPLLEEESSGDRNEVELEPAQDDSPGSDPDEFTLEDYMNEEDTPSYRLSTNNYSADDKQEEIPFSVGSTFHEHLESQLGMRHLSEQQMLLADYIIGNIDEDGYLRRDLESIVDDIAFMQNIETNVNELQYILDVIHDLEPAGVGARDLQECLLLQLKVRDHSIEAVVHAEIILSNYFEEFTKKHYDRIIARMGITEADLRNAIDEVLKCNPKPGSGFSDPLNKMAQHVTPDFLLEYKDGNLQLMLNSKNAPELRISNTYNDMLDSYARSRNQPLNREQKELVTFVKQKLDSAKWFIDAIRQRQNTLMVTMQAIIDYQREYFIDGDETHLKPMILKDIADKTGLDISTISRVANSKYIQTHFGIYALKYFFSEGMQTDSGEEVSTREIKKILEECIENEDKRKPLTDDALADILKDKGYPIARRTVAKYREQLGVSVARLRKEL